MQQNTHTHKQTYTYINIDIDIYIYTTYTSFVILCAHHVGKKAAETLC